MPQTTKIERVRKLIKWLIYDGFAENDRDLAEKLGYSRSSFSQIMTEKVPLSDKFIDNITSVNGHINKDWVLTGNGALHKPNSLCAELDDYSGYLYPEAESLHHVPLYVLNSAADTKDIFEDVVIKEFVNCVYIPYLDKCDGAIYMHGNSMYPLLSGGDILIYQKIKRFIENILWGEVYLVYFTNNEGDDYLLVKRIQKSEKGIEYIKLVSEDSKYEPKHIELEKIKGLAFIKASVRINSMI